MGYKNSEYYLGSVYDNNTSRLTFWDHQEMRVVEHKDFAPAPYEGHATNL